MSAFTPGPWNAVANSWQITTVYDAKQMPVCRLDLEDWGVDEEIQSELEKRQSEVARLIAAAPELLEALRPFANYACDVPCDCHNCKARAAIAKAGGAA
jgi:hypothetical protein